MMWAFKFVWHFIWLLDFRTILTQYSDIELLYFAYIYIYITVKLALQKYFY